MKINERAESISLGEQLGSRRIVACHGVQSGCDGAVGCMIHAPALSVVLLLCVISCIVEHGVCSTAVWYRSSVL